MTPAHILAPPLGQGPQARASNPDRPADFWADVRQSVPVWVRSLLSNTLLDMEASPQNLADADGRPDTTLAVKLLRRQLDALAQQVVLALEKSLDQRGSLAAPSSASRPGPGPVPGLRLTLSLMDESQIDQDIEIGRLVQAIESGADLELKHLAAMCAGLLGHLQVDQQTLPLPPSVCAQALHAGVCTLSNDLGLRTLLLRQLGQTMGPQMKRVYAAQAERLNQWGVLPAVFRLMPCADEVGPSASASASASAAAAAADACAAEDGDARPSLQASLRRLVAHTHNQEHAKGHEQGHEPAHPLVRDHADITLANCGVAAASPPETSADFIQLIEPLPLGPSAPVAKTASRASFTQASASRLGARGPDLVKPSSPEAPALDRHTAKRLMQRFLDHIEAQVLPSDTGVAVLLGLRAPALALAVAEPRLWQTLDHPWWTLLDHFMAHAANPEHSAADRVDPLGEALYQAVRSLNPQRAGERALWQAACNQVQAAVSRAVQDRQQALQPLASGLQSQVEREELQSELRNQILQQLRSTPVSPPLRRFLLDTWTLVLTQTALQSGAHSSELANRALVVDDLIRATQTAGKRVSSAQRAVLLRQAQAGLQQLGWQPAQLEAELTQLGQLLDKPPPAQEEVEAEPAGPLAAAWTLDLNASLPTVPLDMNQLPVAGELSAALGWIQSLQPGAHCRLFLLGRWMTAQLSWASDTRNLFLFNSRHGGRVHSLTKRMLQKLREAGLAASIEDGLLVAQAMDSLVDTNFAAD